MRTHAGRDPHQIYAACSRKNQNLKREILQIYRQKTGRFADENFIINLARGAGNFDAQKGENDQICAQDKIKFSAQNQLKFNQKAA